MSLKRHDDGSLGRNKQPNPIERLSQQGSRSEQGRKLLRPLVAAQVPDERAQPHAFPSGEHNGPERSAPGRLPLELSLVPQLAFHDHPVPPHQVLPPDRALTPPCPHFPCFVFYRADVTLTIRKFQRYD